MATKIRIKRGTESQITGYAGPHLSGELAYATNTGSVFVNDGIAFISIGGSGATPTLQSVTDAGNTTTNNIGIGTTAPAFPLDVVSNSSTNAAIFRVRSANDLGNIRFTSYDNTEILGSLYFQREGVGTGNLRFYTAAGSNNSERMRITPQGNVGIGTSTPDAALEVEGTIKASTHGDGFVLGSPTTVKYKLGVYGANDLLFKDPNNNVLMALTAAGNVGIGTTAPSEKLEVAGTISQTVLNYAPSDDPNNIATTRFFRTHVSSSNTPVPSFGMGLSIVFEAGSAVQFITDRSNTSLYMRKQASGAWGGWVKLRDENSISDTDISNWNNAYLFWSGTSGSGNNWDNVDTNAFIRGHTTTLNYPPELGQAFLSGLSVLYDAGNGWQMASNRNATPLYFRKQVNGTWQSWKKLWSTVDMPQTDVDNWGVAYSNWTGRVGTGNNWNNIDTSTIIRGHNTTLNYPPELGAFFLSGLSVLYSAGNGWQIASDRTVNSNLYFRKAANGSWGGWRRILSSDDIYVDNSNGNIGIGTTAPNSKVHISGTAMQQLRMETSGGPAAASDASGRVGDMAYDDDFFYIKTNNGWGRMALDFGF